MSSTLESADLFEKPQPAEVTYMIAGWRQWADGGGTSSGLAQYLINTLGAKKIGQIKPDGFYLYQTPLSQAMFRPQVKFEEGYRTQLIGPRNEVYYWTNGKKGLVIFLGDEPHMNVERYAEAFFEIVQQLNVKRVAATGGVYAMVPYDKERSFSCSYSLPGMKAELADYAINFSNYEGGVSIGSYLNDRAEYLGIEYYAMYAFVPAYDLSQVGPRGQSVTIEEDYKAWHDALLRLNHMFKLGLDLSDLSVRSKELVKSIENHIDELSKQLPNVPIREYIAKVTADFEERHFDRLDDVWQDALGDIFKDLD